jgi:hypothetical protein
LEYVPHRSRFDFVGLLTYVGFSRRTRHVASRRRKQSTEKETEEDDENPTENSTEDDSMSILYDPNTGLLRDATTDSSFSEWRWCMLRDATSQRQLTIKLFTNSRTKGCSILESHVGKVILLSDLIMLTADGDDSDRRSEEDTHSMFARSTDMTDVLVLDDPFKKQENTTVPTTSVSFWSERNVQVVKEHEEVAQRMCEKSKQLAVPLFKCEKKYPRVRWLLPRVENETTPPYVHMHQRSNEREFSNRRTSRYPNVSLRDLDSFSRSLHFREYRILRCSGIIESITMENASKVDLSNVKEEWTSVVANPKYQPVVNSLIRHSSRRVLVTLRSMRTGADDAGDDGSQQEKEYESTKCVLEVALMPPTEGMPSTVPNSLYSLARKKRSQTAGGLPTPMDAVVACFACGMQENDPLVSELMSAPTTSKQVQVLHRALRGRRFDCLIEIERVPAGMRQKRPSLIVVKEIPT